MKTYFILLSFVVFSSLVTNGAEAKKDKKNLDLCGQACSDASLSTTGECMRHYSDGNSQVICQYGNVFNQKKCLENCNDIYNN